MKKDKIVVGPLAAPLFTFTSEQNEIRSISTVCGVDIVGSELTVDILASRVRYPYTEDSAQIIAGVDFEGVLSSDNYLMATSKTYDDFRPTPYGTLVWYYRDDVLKSKSYIKSIDRVAEDVYKINAISAIGLLEAAKNHNGGLYRGAKFIDVLADIIGGIVPYTVNSELNNIPIYGWLPYNSRRENLHQLLFSCGVMVGRNSAGDMRFQFLANDTHKPIPNGNLYEGGNIKYEDTISTVSVTEHSFMELPTDETVVEYDNTDGSETASHTFIAFRNAPLHDLQSTGSLTIESSGINWAIVSGTGILSGKKYTHSTRVMTRTLNNATGQQENVATISDVYLVNVANSENVAQRVLSYYSSGKTVTASLVVGDEKPGDLVTGADPYGDDISGFITSMEAVVSTKIKASTKIITGYTPTQGGNNYTRWYLLSGSDGVWTIPAFVFEKERPLIQVSVCGGGHGGYSGSDGDIGKVRNDPFRQSGTGEGGDGGAPGPGGRVATFTIDCTGLTSFSYTLGAGGESESEGGASTFGSYSSASGAPLPYGLGNIFTGTVYALAGTARGTKGGNGMPSSEASVSYGGQTWYGGEKGYDYPDYGYTQEGGYGGGAAVGANGNRGGTGFSYRQGDGTIRGVGGKGGAGANAIAAPAATGLGEGGPGGHGGGGGGLSGTGRGYAPSSNDGDGGDGGKGGAGGRGGPGFILIYA